MPYATLKEFLEDAWLRASGCEELEPDVYQRRLDELHELCVAFWEHQLVRLVIGGLRYGRIVGYGMEHFDYVDSMRKRLNAYTVDGNYEHLIDVANICLVTYFKDMHRTLRSCDDGEHAQPSVQSWQFDVEYFWNKFLAPLKGEPGKPNHKGVELAIRLIHEEYDELCLALESADLVEIIDAICDLVYVIVGLAIALGVDLRPCWAEVQRSNVSKVGGARRADGKILKPEGWLPPDIKGALVRQGFKV